MANPLRRFLLAIGIVAALVAVAIAGTRLTTPTVVPRLARDVAPASTVLPDGAVVQYSCANEQLSGGFQPNQVTISCASATLTVTPEATLTPTETVTDTPTDSPTVTPTSTVSDTPTSMPPPTETATSVPTDTPTPAATTVAHWTGGLGFIVNTSTMTLWNTGMRPNDVTNVTLGSVANIPKLTRGKRYVGLQFSGTPATPVTQVTAANLATIDTTYQAADGPVVEWLYYSDDNYSDTIANKIALMKSTVDTIHGYARANNAPAFKVIYVPAGVFLNTYLPANPILATYPDGVLFQTQPFEDSPVGADDAYVSTVASVIGQLRALAPDHPAAIQVQVYSKSNPVTVWTAAKVIADIDADGAAANPDWINVYWQDGSAQAAAQAVLIAVIANYRP